MLNREPMGMKPEVGRIGNIVPGCFSAQPRADGDEAEDTHTVLIGKTSVSVLNREPMGMKPQAA